MVTWWEPGGREPVDMVAEVFMPVIMELRWMRGRRRLCNQWQKNSCRVLHKDEGVRKGGSYSNRRRGGAKGSLELSVLCVSGSLHSSGLGFRIQSLEEIYQTRCYIC